MRKSVAHYHLKKENVAVAVTLKNQLVLLNVVN
jgi:hypothetical protein